MGQPITKDEELIFEDAEKAAAFVRDLKGRVRFQVMARVFLPTTEGRGFESVACITISRKKMMEVIRSALSPTLQSRGAKIKLRLTAPSGGSGLSFVAVY